MLAMLSLMAAMAVSVPIGRIGPYITVDRVYINGQGPFRFLIDTGAQSSAVSEQLALRVGLRPEARVEQVTPAGAHLVPATQAHVTVNETGDKIELLIGGIDQVKQIDQSIEGVLGSNFFLRGPFLLQYDRRVLTISAPTPAGERLPIETADGRPIVTAAVNQSMLRLALDSGAPALILFDKFVSSRTSSVVATNVGRASANMTEAFVRLPGLRPKTMRAATLQRFDRVDGLLPLGYFRSVFVDPVRKFAIFED
jgi:hypothetical protein